VCVPPLRRSAARGGIPFVVISDIGGQLGRGFWPEYDRGVVFDSASGCDKVVTPEAFAQKRLGR
jgi:hypothetical protein